MHTAEVEKLLRSDGGSPGRSWPPKSEALTWDLVQARRRRYDNDPAQLFPYRTDLHIPGDAKATQARQRDYCPVPLARDIARFSSQLLFSEPPKLTIEDEVAGPALDAWTSFNRLDQFLADAGDNIAAEGSGALRIIRDDHVSGTFPLIIAEPADRVIWATAHGRYTTGGVVVVERDSEEHGVRWRLLEYHGPGVVRRALFKGSLTGLGSRVELGAGPLEFQKLRAEVFTGVDKPTLIKCDNVPGGHSDIAGLDSLLDAIDDAETVGKKKLRGSKPLTFVNRKLSDAAGDADLDGAILIGEGTMSPIEEPNQLAQVVQGRMEAEDHRVYTDHLRELAVSMAGYSLASWGFGDGGRADSGRALKLRQVRTLLTRSGKERIAREAISEAVGVAVAMMLGRSEVVKPEIQFGDGFPEDAIERAEELAKLRDAGLISTRQALRELHPDFDEDKIAEELQEIQAETPTSDPVRDLLNGVG
ncbi:hypothetical protein BH24ACT22_BH24ACT22_13600 [soil metagenome]